MQRSIYDAQKIKYIICFWCHFKPMLIEIVNKLNMNGKSLEELKNIAMQSGKEVKKSNIF